MDDNWGYPNNLGNLHMYPYVGYHPITVPWSHAHTQIDRGRMLTDAKSQMLVEASDSRELNWNGIAVTIRWV